MTADELRASQAPLKARYRDDPAAASATLRVAGTLDPERLTCRIDRAGPIEAGLHPLAGGDGRWACSGDMLLESLAACAGVTLCAVAVATGQVLRGGRVVAEGDLDFRGTLGVSRDVPVGFRAIRLRFELDTDADADQRANLLRLTERYCVIFQTLRTPPELSASL